MTFPENIAIRDICQRDMRFAVIAERVLLLGMETIGDRIKKFRNRLGWTQTELAEKCGYEGQSRIAGYEAMGKKKHGREPSFEDVKIIAGVLGVEVSDLILEGGDFVGESLPTGIKRTPVVGTAQLGESGYWHEIDYPAGHGDGYVDAPSLDPGAYALRVKGDSMAPTIRNGWIVLIEPNSSTHPGELVAVCLQDGRCMVKEFLFERGGTVTLGSVNQDHKPITVDRSEITRFHHVGAIIPPSKWQPI